MTLQAVQAPVYLPSWAYEAGDDSDAIVAIAAAEGTVAAVGSGSDEPTEDATLSTTPPIPAAAWPDQLTEEEMRDVLTLAGWPAELHDEALRVARCESSWSPGAYNGADPNHGSHGLFQLNGRLWFDYAGEDFEARYDPLVNARAALAVYGYSDGWNQWTCRP